MVLFLFTTLVSNSIEQQAVQSTLLTFKYYSLHRVAVVLFASKLFLTLHCDSRPALSLYYLMTIRFHYDVDKFQKRIEPFCHTFVLGVPLMTAVVSVSLDLIKPTGQLCLISDPMLFIVSAGSLFILHVSTNVICMLWIYIHLYLVERHIGRNLSQSVVHLNLIASRKKLAKQARRFVFACLITYTPPLLLEIETQPLKDVVEILCSILFPLQG